MELLHYIFVYSRNLETNHGLPPNNGFYSFLLKGVLPAVKATLFVLLGLLVLGGNVFACVRHKAALRNHNMVRFNGDVIKRKDVVKAKKVSAPAEQGRCVNLPFNKIPHFYA